MRPWRRALASMLVLGVAACSGGGVSPAVLQTWVGKPVTGLRQEWGPATRQVADGGLTLHVYEEMERRTGGNFDQQDPEGRLTRYEAMRQEAARSPRVYVRSYHFWVDGNGKIVRAEVRQP